MSVFLRIWGLVRDPLARARWGPTGREDASPRLRAARPAWASHLRLEAEGGPGTAVRRQRDRRPGEDAGAAATRRPRAPVGTRTEENAQRLSRNMSRAPHNCQGQEKEGKSEKLPQTKRDTRDDGSVLFGIRVESLKRKRILEETLTKSK